MSRGRRYVAFALGFCFLVAAAGIGWSVWGEDLRYRHALVKYEHDPGLPNEYVNLDDGEAQFSIGSPDRHRIDVQWRDPDGHGWTAPETVWTNKDALALDNQVRYGGGTVAVLQTFTTDDHDDSDIGLLMVGIVCRHLSCEAQGLPGMGGEPQVTPDGRTAFLGQDQIGAYLWTAEEGIRLERWSGHPGFEYGVDSPSTPVLAPDGSLRIVGSHPSDVKCTFELFTSAPHTADLTSVGHITERLHGQATERLYGRADDCRSSLATYSTDWVELRRAHSSWFVRDGDAWTTTRDDPSGLEKVDVDRGCCLSHVSDFVHWNDVAYGSPDGHRIRVQTHLLGEEAWGEPQVLDGAPAGFRCAYLEGHIVGDEGMAVTMTCYSGKVLDMFHGDAYALAVTPDLRNWESTFVSGVSHMPHVDGDRIQVGDTTWSAQDGFSTR